MENKILQLKTRIGLTKVFLRFNDGFGDLLDIEQVDKDRLGRDNYQVVSLTVAELEQILAYAKGEIVKCTKNNLP